MFCPDGFVTIEAVYDRLYDAIFNVANITDHFFHDAGNCYGPDGYKEKHRDAHDLKQNTWLKVRQNLTAQEIFPDWAIWQMLRSSKLNVFICSPEGNVLKTTKWFFYGRGRLSFDDFALPVEQDSSLSELIEEITDEKGEEYYLNGLTNDGYFIEPFLWTIRSPTEIRDSFEWLEEERQRYSYRAFEKVKTAAINAGVVFKEKQIWTAEEDDGTLEFVLDFAKRIAPFEGWALCFQDEDIPSSPAELLAMTNLALNLKEGLMGETPSPSQVVEQIIQLHRDGHPVVRDVVRKQLAHWMNTEEWRATWKMATDQCPELSKRGPKRGRRNS